MGGRTRTLGDGNRKKKTRKNRKLWRFMFANDLKETGHIKEEINEEVTI